MDHLTVEILGGVFVGLSLGLVGAGGAILTVPIFGAVLGHPSKAAILEALAVTGCVAAAAGIGAAWRNEVSWRQVLLFGLPGVAGAVVAAPVAQWMPAAVQTWLFVLLAAVAAWRMWGSKDGNGGAAVDGPPQQRPAWTIATGLLVGVLTSILGVGGGFILIPALVLLEGLPMPRAVATSLVVIAINAGASLVSAAAAGAFDQVPPAWRAVAVIAGVGMVASVLGRRLAAHIPAPLLRRSFAAALLAVAGYMAWMQCT